MLKKYIHIILLTLGIFVVNLFPSFFLIPGTYFLLDTGFSPFTEFKGFFDTSIYWHLQSLGSYFLGYALYSKVYMLFVVLTGITTGILLSRFIALLFPQFKGKWLDILAIITTTYNPFIYERIISQTNIALGTYMILIGLLLLLISTISNKNNVYKYLGVAISLGFAWMIYPHAILLIVLVFFTNSLVYYKNIGIYIYIFIAIVALNMNWLIGDYILGTNTTASTLETFNRANIEVFQGNSLSSLGVEITHLLGYGFWGEKYHISSPDDLMKYWYIFGFIVLGIIIYGGFKMYARSKKVIIILSIIGVVSYILALGIASAPFGFISEFLYTNFSFYIGMREPQKWLGLTQIVYMILLCVGSIHIIKNILHIQYLRLIALFIVILPILWTPNSLIGYWGQLNISDYPDDIFEAEAYISKVSTKNDIYLNLPWHSYMSCSRTYGKITANRNRDIFYPANIISSDNIEISYLYTNSTSSRSKDINTYLKSKDIELLKKYNITHILFSATCGSYKSYNFLEDFPEIYKRVFDSEHVDIFKINYEK